MNDALRIVDSDAALAEPPSEPAPPLLLTAVDIARALQVSERTVRRLHKQGRLPRPLKISRALRWRRDEFLAWLSAGCPKRTDWHWQPRRPIAGLPSVADAAERLENYPQRIKTWFFSNPWSIPLWILLVVLPSLVAAFIRFETLLRWLGVVE